MNNAEKLASPKRMFIFFRDDGFYHLEIPDATVADNARANPGTDRVEDAITREIVWDSRNESATKDVNNFLSSQPSQSQCHNRLREMSNIIDRLRKKARETGGLEMTFTTDDDYRKLETECNELHAEVAELKAMNAKAAGHFHDANFTERQLRAKLAMCRDALAELIASSKMMQGMQCGSEEHTRYVILGRHLAAAREGLDQTK